MLVCNRARQTKDQRAVGRRNQQMGQATGHEQRRRPEPDAAGAVVVDATTLHGAHQQAAHHPDADDPAEQQFAAAQRLDEVVVAEEQAGGRRHRRVGGVGQPECRAEGPHQLPLPRNSGRLLGVRRIALQVRPWKHGRDGNTGGIVGLDYITWSSVGRGQRAAAPGRCRQFRPCRSHRHLFCSMVRHPREHHASFRRTPA